VTDWKPSPSQETAIYDGQATPLPSIGRPGGEVTPIVGFQDHLLRRFGRAELVRLSRNGEFEVRRKVADEIWVLVEGTADFHLDDGRAESPTQGTRETHHLASPTRLLVPFGVGLRVVARSTSAVFLRIMTHSEVEDPP
jgi:hypothetical protein